MRKIKIEILTFAKKIYLITRRVPRGRVTTYQAIARAIGRPQASRAVGNALNKNPYAPQVPCHRVVRSDGKVGGFAGGTRKKIMMLRQEGVVIKGGKISLVAYLYDFSKRR